MAYVTVDINLNKFEDEDLIEELEDRGFQVTDGFTKEELDDILERYSWSLPGTLGHSIYEKLKNI